MFRRGITLIELLVAMTLFAIVASLVMMVFSNQNRSFKMESDKAEVALMAKGSLDELTHAARMTGSGLPEEAAGIRVEGNRLTFVTNERGGMDAVIDYEYDKNLKRLGVRVSNASQFSHKGYVLLPLMVPPSPTYSNHVVGILQRFISKSGCNDSLVLDAAPLLMLPTDDVRTFPDAQVYNLDSVSFWKQDDTLFVQRNRLDRAVFAVGLESLEWRFWNATAGWQSTTDALGSAKRIDKIGIRLVTRNQSIDAKLLQYDSASRGYRFSTLETEVALRNTGLVNK